MRLSRTGIADEMRADRTRRIFGGLRRTAAALAPRISAVDDTEISGCATVVTCSRGVRGRERQCTMHYVALAAAVIIAYLLFVVAYSEFAQRSWNNSYHRRPRRLGFLVLVICLTAVAVTLLAVG
jgi:hypothetical protein